MQTEANQFYLTTSTTSAILLFAHSLCDKFDGIVTSDIEHPVVTHALQKLVARSGCRVQTLNFRDDVERTERSRLAERVAAIQTANKKQRLLWVISHVDYATGAVLPVEELAHQIRKVGTRDLILFDGAHGPGNISVSLRELEIDGYAFCGHKWLMGTPGSGFLWVHSRLRTVLEEAEYEGPSLKEDSPDRAGIRGTLPLEPFLTCDAQLAYLELVGWSRVFKFQKSMRDMLLDLVDKLDVFSPINSYPEMSSILALRCKGSFGHRTEVVFDRLRGEFVVGSYLRQRKVGRLCLPCFVSENDVENVGMILEGIAKKLRAERGQ